MLRYIASLPHAPQLHALINDVHHAVPTSVVQAFQRVASDIHQRGIKTIIVLGGHPRYTRQGFSTYIDAQYSLDFKEFGDLVHTEPMDASWELYQHLREIGARQQVIVHPIADSELDFAHTIPLWLLARQWPAEFRVRVLAINDHGAATEAERVQFGQVIAQAIHASGLDCALIISQECLYAESMSPDIIQGMKDLNTELRYQSSSLWSQASSTTSRAPLCTQGVYTIAKQVVGSSIWAYEELCFEHVGATSLLAARLLPPVST